MSTHDVATQAEIEWLQQAIERSPQGAVTVEVEIHVGPADGPERRSGGVGPEES